MMIFKCIKIYKIKSCQECIGLKLKIVSVDYAPEDLSKQVPFTISLIREMKVIDRPDYWLAKVDKTLIFENGKTKEINYLILATRYAGTSIKKGIGNTILGLAYVVDETLLQDLNLNFSKCEYVAICESEEINE
jgi:hypothetical protein